MVKRKKLKNGLMLCNLPVRFKLGVSFSFLHIDDNHPVENNKAHDWYSPECEECADSEKLIEFLCYWTSVEEITDALFIFYIRLQCSYMGVTLYHKQILDLSPNP